MSLTIKGRLWKDGKNWKAEIAEFDMLVKASEPRETLELLSKLIDENAEGMLYEINAETDGPLIFETDQWKKCVLLILKRRIL